MVNMQAFFGAMLFGVLLISPASARCWCDDGQPTQYPYGQQQPYYGGGWGGGWGTPGMERREDRRDYRQYRRYDRRSDRRYYYGGSNNYGGLVGGADAGTHRW